MFHHIDDEGRLATEAEADREYAENVGRENPDQCWILSDRDVWYRNPFYTGPDEPHPESYHELADDLDAFLDEATEEDQQYQDFKRLQILVWKVIAKVPRGAFPPGLYEQLADAAENSEQWFQSDDPRENGWVGDDGLP